MLFSRFSVFILILGRPSWIFVEVSADYSFSRSVMIRRRRCSIQLSILRSMCRALVKHVYLKKHTQKLSVKLKKLRKLDKHD